MTDKQITEPKNGYYCIEPCIEIKQLKEQLQRKEQECKELKEINLTLLEYRRHAVTCQECYEDGLEDGKTSNKELRKLKQTLAEIKPILEYYANSTIGYKTKDGIYRIELSYKYGYSNSCGEPCYYEYNPKPAKEALRKINEVEDEKESNRM